jgi:C_GCAxxG_C_C family probable redox protein
MADYPALKKKVEELAERTWDAPAIEDRVKKLLMEGIDRKTMNQREILSSKQAILNRIQQRGEEYNFIARNCARSSALAVMEEFGIGSMEMIKALTPFPGFGGTGWMCGGVTGGLMALGLYFGSNDILDFEAAGITFVAARKFMVRFEETVGAFLCPKIQEEVVFGRYMDPGASIEKMEAFIKSKGIEKCSLLPGIGARLAAEIIIESLE